MGFLDTERDALPLWLPVAFAAGIALWFVTPFGAQRLAVAAALLGVAAAGVLARGRLVWVPALLALAGLGVAEIRSRSVAHDVLVARTVVAIAGKVEAVEARADRDVTRVVVRLDAMPGLPERVRLTLRQAPPPGLVPGARIATRAALAPPAPAVLPGGYDFARRAWFTGIGATGFPMAAVRVTRAAPPATGAVTWLAAIRARLTAHIRAAVPGSAGAVAAAFVTGDQGAIPLATAQAMRDAGLAHLLSISGLHIAVVVGGAIWLTRRGLALVPRLALAWPLRGIAVAVGAATGLAYTLLAGAEVPTVRSILATLLVLIGIMLGREALSLRMLAAAAFLILLIRPEALVGASFQLSFAAVIAIVALYESRLGQWLTAHVEAEHEVATLARRLVGVLVTGLVAEAALAPIGLFHFNRAGLYGALANLVAIPWSTFVIMPSLVLALFADLFGLPWLWPLAGWTVAQLVALADWTAALPGAVVRAAAVPMAAYALAVVGGLWVALWRSAPRWWGLPLLAGGLVVAAAAPSPDVFVSGDGRHVAIATRDGLAFLRPRVGDYLRDMWSDALGEDGEAALVALPGAQCSADACLAEVVRDGRRWRILLTISRDLIPRDRFDAACATADIVVSDRRLPRWCRPTWLKLDRTRLKASGAMTIDLSARSTTSVAAAAGDHPWSPGAFKPQ
ncbi:hypothetical protein IP88_05640 [alpha proteobacterium AAP81b]|nr:hypothetical protein IP88_05640 [alpha proteobacterium AAP81b]